MAYYGYDRKKEYEDLKTQGIISRISNKYYEDEIRELHERIANISTGRGDMLGGYVYTSSEHLRTPEQRQKAIKKLRERVNQLEEKSSAVSQLKSELNHAMYGFEKIIEEDALHDALYYCLREYLMYKKTNSEGKIEDVKSNTYEELFKSGKIRRSKIGRVHCKDMSELRQSREKINKKVYKQLKEKKNLVVIDRWHLILKELLSKNGYSLEGFANSMYYEKSEGYHGYPYSPKISNLGVKMYDLDSAKRTLNEKGYHRSNVSNIYREIEYFIKHYHGYSHVNKLYKFRSRFEEVFEFEKEVEVVSLIVDAFSNTAISDSHTMKWLREYLSDKRKKLNKLENDLIEDYNSSKVRDMLEAQKRVEALYQEYLVKMGIYNNLEKTKGYSDPELAAVRNEISDIRVEMISIVRKYPELNKDEYKIDLDKYKKRFKEVEDELVPKERKVEPVVNEVEVKATQVEERVISTPRAAITNEEPRKEDKYRIGSNPESVVKEDEPIIRVETPDELRGTRTAYYNNYMVEKMKKTELGKLKFSEYLEKVAPFQKELIEVEKEREARAATVYKLYLKYLASLEDKTYAMRFTEFAQRRYGFEPSDIPVEYDEMESQRKL